jgi:DNA polymerase phi
MIYSNICLLDNILECLFDSDTTHQRKFWGFQLFEKALKLCPEENISSLFTPNFMRALINNSYEKNRYLHEAAIRSVN